MTLTLKIDNYDVLQDGGPTFVTVTGKGLQIGRSTSMDWTLPDPERHISSHHFSIEYRDSAYFLVDCSTNGVFLDGQRHRIEGAHRLQSGDRFQVGHYYVVATVEGAAPKPTGFTPTAATPAAAPAPMAPPADDHDPWSMGAPATPINPNPTPNRDPFADFSQDFIVNPHAPVASPAPAPVPQPSQQGSASPFGDAPAAAPAPGMQPMVPQAAPPPAAAPMPGQAQAAAGNVLAAFCEGAGLPAGSYGAADAEALARELGRTMRVASQELMAMLQDRASAKKFTRGGERTMMGNTENNPLKFLPDAAQALEVMFLQPRPGFMEGGTGMDAALRDVRTHQMAVFAAIQPALIQLLADLSPEAIEEDAGSGGLLSGGGKRKAWDTFVERWDGKVGAHENGMLGAFLEHFAESYRTAVQSAKR